jgi:hypothetical protein
MLALLTPGLLAGEDAAEKSIRAVLEKQVEDWNRGDITLSSSAMRGNCTSRFSRLPERSKDRCRPLAMAAGA